MRRGACPTLATPMQTGDGLLVRLRPVRSGFALSEIVTLASAARRFGNGILEVTARGNLQIRGLVPETVPALAAVIADADIDITDGVAIETPPLAGMDPAEIINPLPLALQIRAAIAGHRPALLLAPKLSIIIDGGGGLHLDQTSADIRLRAFRVGSDVLWLLGIAGTEKTAERIAVLPAADVVPAVLLILAELARRGRDARGRDLDGGMLARVLGSTEGLQVISSREPAPLPAGIHDCGGNGPVLGLALAFGQTDVESLLALADRLERLGVHEIRLAPGHALLVPGLKHGDVPETQAFARTLGFLISPDDPGNHIAACAGMGACASALLDTKAVARLFIDTAPEVLDGSLAVHLSGCAKGCARPSAATLTMLGAPLGYGLVVNGPASAAPNAYIEQKTIKTAVVRLGALVRDNKHAGESARSCLTRLGTDVVIAAVQQG
ncbi:precorrin-3B synthase [Pararhizobium antarcticum]|uniref:Precorrin-3B synthase n=1 Tax=Pararhizobium antarcticum TaxID=1798805 RepID=A0A657M048_9HYPH|nr:precorrin-3B synthase [Pararhizobium antarcticum]OJF96551.1 precorrin-3B synthase [Rhizobium sp. 58]OJG01444.1 precorrin-3B synthase [Pararhizobium antarcticum]